MAKIRAQQLLQYAFSEKELAALLQNRKFLQRHQKTETIEEFEELCVFGFLILEEAEKVERTSLPAFQPKTIILSAR